MAYFDESNEEELFGIDTATEDDSLLDEEQFKSPIKPTSDPKGITKATEEDKARAKETPEEKGRREAAEKAEADSKLKAELEKDWDDEDTDLNKKPKSSTDPKRDENSEPLEGIAEFADSLFKIGFFTRESDDEEIPATEEALIAKLEREKELGAESIVEEFASRHGEEYKKAFDAIFVDGVNPREYLSKFEEIKSYKELDMKDVDNQVKVVEADLRKQGWEEDDIKSKIRSLKLNSELESESLMHQKALVRRESTELQRESEKAKQVAAQQIAFKKQYNNNVHTILSDKLKTREFEGIPVTKELANKVQEFLTDDTAFKLPTGELISPFDAAILELNKPHNHEAKVLLGMLLAENFEPGKPIKINLGKVAKAAISKENKEIFNFAKKTTSKLTNTRERENENLLKDF